MIEIAGLEPEEKVRRKRHDGNDGVEEFRALGRQEIIERRDRRQRHHRIQRRQQPPHAPLVEPRKGKASGRKFRLDDPGDQVAGDDKENIDADKAAEHRRRLEMKRHHRQHRDSAQPVDVFAVPRCRGS
jgi:hypothetical protein